MEVYSLSISVYNVRAERAQNNLIIIDMHFLHGRPLLRGIPVRLCRRSQRRSRINPRFCLQVGHSLRSLSPPVSLPLRSAFRRTLLHHPLDRRSLCEDGCLQLPFASVGLGMDFARYACHNIGHHHLAAGPSPAHNKALHRTAIPLRSIVAGERKD